MKSDDHAGGVDALTLRASALSDEPEPAIIDSIQTRFRLPAGANRAIWLDMQSGLLWEKQLFLNNVRLYGLVSSKYGKPLVSLLEWWDVTKGRCDFYAPAGCC